MKELKELEQLLTPKATFRASDTLKVRIMDAAKAETHSTVPLRVNKRRAWYYAAASVALLIALGAVLLSLEVNKVEEDEPIVAHVAEDAYPSENDETETNNAIVAAEPMAPILAEVAETPVTKAKEPVHSAKANRKPVASNPTVAENVIETQQVATIETLPLQEEEATGLSDEGLDLILAQLQAESMARVQQCDMECFNEKIMVRAQRLELIVDEEIKKCMTVNL